MNLKFAACLLAVALIAPFVPLAPLVSGWGGREGNPELYSVYRGLREFGVEDAWKMGYTGEGVKVAVIDSGIDFATPDLIGTQARVENETSPYHGWPIVIDLKSLSSYQSNSFGYYSQYADTSSTDTEGYTLTGTSKGGVYHIGNHSDQHLTNYYREPVKVLVVDEQVSGVYNTVYVDLNNNHDFRDDKPCRKGDEPAYWDRDDDGYPDESGGMIYFIADGKIPLPFSRMLYGEEARMPENGELVAFHFDPGAHGTMCASTIAAQGRNVKGIAPEAKLIPVRTFGYDDMILCLLASLGYDGIPDTGDEANVVSRSGAGGYLTKGADETSAFLEHLTTEISPHTTLVFANGNSGSGYSTCGSPSSEHVINAGAIYDMWWNNSTYRGDVTCFSSRGPNVLGQVKPNVLATGYYAPESKPLWLTHSGKAAWDMEGGGTSDATPHVSAVVALIYQAYKETYGEFPTSEKARDILMSSATDIKEEVFAQGSGVINAKRAMEIIRRKNGALVEPAFLVTEPVKAGSMIEANFTISNYYGEPIELKPQNLVRTKMVEIVAKEGIFHVENDLLDCDLLKLSSYYNRNKRDTRMEGDEGYVLYLYNWMDKNGNEKMAKEELEMIAGAEWASGYTSEVRMTEPKERIDDGLFFKLEKLGKSEEAKVVIECFEWKSWEMEIRVEGNRASCKIKAPEATGVYQGKISLGETGQSIPISFATYMKDKIEIKGGSGPYDNAKLYGRFEGEPKDRWESRLYPIYHEGEDALITIEVEWDDPEADIDGFLFNYGSVNSSHIWSFSTPPPVELPELKVLRITGSTVRAYHHYTKVGSMGYSGSYRYSYNVFRTSTGKKRDVFTGVLRNGLNIIMLMEVIPGNKYGENIKIETKIEPFEDMNVNCIAGERIRLPTDTFYGFSCGENIRFEEKKLNLRMGDVLLLLPNSTYYFPMLFFDSNKDEVLNWESDETVFGENLVGENGIELSMIPIRKNGTYFLTGFSGELYHLEKHRRSILPVKAPEKAGVYVSIAENDGNLLPVPVTLTVKAGKPASIDIKTAERVGCGVLFEAELEARDKFGNSVDENINITLEFDDSTRNVEIKQGKGTAILRAPDIVGKYRIKAQSSLGSAETYIETTREPIITLSNISVQNKGIKFDIGNMGGSGSEVNIYTNPVSYILPEQLSQIPVGLLSSVFYREGLLPLSANTTVHLASGEHEEISLHIQKDLGEFASMYPYLVVITDLHQNIIVYKEVNTENLRAYSTPSNVEGLKELREIETTFVNEPLSFKAEGFISVQLNDLQPLFFVTYGAISIFPDEIGELRVKMDDQSYTIRVIEGEEKITETEAPVEREKPLPTKIESVEITSTSGTIKICWQPSREEGLDHYNIYRLRGDALIKLAEVDVPEYTMEGRLWSSYTFRISAVDETGNESELSDPVGIVVIP